MSGFKLLSHEILRDPTKDELYNGPKREKLPIAVQKMDQADTACTFCGVSYFVFAEVQELQQKAKCYQKHFQTIVQWMRAEKSKQSVIKNEMMSFQSQYNLALTTLQSKLENYNTIIQRQFEENREQKQQISKLSTLLATSKDEVEKQKQICLNDANCRVSLLEEKLHQKDEELARFQQQMANSLQEAAALHSTTEEELKREKSALCVQIDILKTNLNSTKQKYDTEIHRLEALILKGEEQSREAAAVTDDLKLKLNEKDRILALKQQEMCDMDQNQSRVLRKTQEELHGANARIQQLQDQLTAAQAMASRTVAEAEVERGDMNKLHEEVAKWKHQTSALEKNKTLLLSERTALKQEIDGAEERLQSVKAQIKTLQQTIDEQAKAILNQSKESKAALEAVKLEYSKEIAQLKSCHTIALENAANPLKERIEQLDLELKQAKEQISQLKMTGEISEKKRDECDRALKEMKQRAASYMEDLQATKLSYQQTKSSLAALERKINQVEQEKNTAIHERNELQQQYDSKSNMHDNKISIAMTEKDGMIERLTNEIHQYKQTIAQLKTKSTIVTTNQESTSEIDRLQEILAQKDEEISLLQQTVHRECLERTSMLEKMRSAKIVPDLMEPATTSQEEIAPGNGLASLYEKLRRSKKSKSKKAI